MCTLRLQEKIWKLMTTMIFFFSTVADIPVRPDIHVVLHAIGPRHGSLLGGFLSEVG